MRCALRAAGAEPRAARPSRASMASTHHLTAVSTLASWRQGGEDTCPLPSGTKPKGRFPSLNILGGSGGQTAPQGWSMVFDVIHRKA